MPLADVHGQDRAIETLKGALASKKVPHAWLFQGPDGTGKELAALGLAQALTCPERPYEGCGVCSSCTRIIKRNHPDVTWLMPEDELVSRGLAGRSDFDHTPSRDIRIEQVRKLQERLAFRALEATHKVALLITAHAMNQNAQNALLKTLEEPPKDTILILVSAAPEKLLPTIRSRCSKANFGPLSIELIAKKLMEQGTKKKKVDPALAAQVAAMAGGSMSRALNLDPAALESRKETIERFEALERNDARGWLQLAETLGEDRQSAEAALDVLQVWLHDIALAQAGVERIVNLDLWPLAQTAATKVSPASLQRRSTLIDEARNAITQRNGAVKLQLERMLIEMFAA